MSTQDIVQKLWNLCNVLRDDGITYHQYVTELTYILFLKMLDETGEENTLKADMLKAYQNSLEQYARRKGKAVEQLTEEEKESRKPLLYNYSWEYLTTLEGIELKNYYMKLLSELGSTGIPKISDIYAKAVSSIEEPKNLQKIISEINKLDWFEAKQEGLEVTVTQGESNVKCSEMSEGQRQLIKILGMLGICKTEDCLVLMDEPDAYMNPRWKYEIKETMDNSLRDAINTQAIVATHDPLVINGVPKEFIRIFTHNENLVSNNGYYFTKVIVPTEDTEGMGIDGLLQSEYYGLSSVLDSETKDKMDEKHRLLIKKKDGTITDNEKYKLLELTNDLENMSFTRNIPTDSYYDEYVAAMHKIYSERPHVNLSAEDIAERNAKAEEILKGLLEK